mmetsp:Transcript_41978/g.94324  ORF Transcript_41978/g.94324 Transcript_41978/m.94324 type:complete len:416 (-) Transcript_41978:61-1308(-)
MTLPAKPGELADSPVPTEIDSQASLPPSLVAGAAEERHVPALTTLCGREASHNVNNMHLDLDGQRCLAHKGSCEPQADQDPVPSRGECQNGGFQGRLEQLMFEDFLPYAAKDSGSALADALFDTPDKEKPRGGRIPPSVADAAPSGDSIETPPMDAATSLAVMSVAGRSSKRKPFPALPWYKAMNLPRRLAIWFIEVRRRMMTSLHRLRDDEESLLSQALAIALSNPVLSCSGSMLRPALRSALGKLRPSSAPEGDLRCVPLSREVAAKLPLGLMDPEINALYLPSSSCGDVLAGEVLQRVKVVLRRLLEEVGGTGTMFKIGITCTPLKRWRAYKEQGYTCMHLVNVSDEHAGVQMLEAALIDSFASHEGCRNIAKGGEGPVGRGPYFNYVVLGTGNETTPSPKRCRVGARCDKA